MDGNMMDVERRRVATFARFRVFTPGRVTVLLTAINMLTYLDRGIVSGAIGNIRASASVTGEGQQQLGAAASGALVSVFMIGFFATSPFFAAATGVLTSRVIMLLGLGAWTVSVAVAGLVQGYWPLFAARAAAGLGEAAVAGVAVTIIDNVAPLRSRTTWIGAYYGMVPIGTAAGVGLGGALSGRLLLGVEGWRALFILEALPMLAFLAVLWFMPGAYNTVCFEPRTESKEEQPAACELYDIPLSHIAAKDPASTHGDPEPSSDGECAEGPATSLTPPPAAAFDAGPEPPDTPRSCSSSHSSDALMSPDLRRASVSADLEADPSGPTAGVLGEDESLVADTFAGPVSALRALFTNHLYLFTVAGFAWFLFALGGLAVWGVAFLQQGPLHLSPVGAAALIGGVSTTAGVAGSLFGGWAVDRMGGSFGIHGVHLSLRFSIVCGAVTLPCGLAAILTTHVTMAAPLLWVAIFALSAITPPYNASLLSLVPRNLRVYAMATNTFLLHLFGNTPSPIVAGLLSERFTEGCQRHLTEAACSADAALHRCYWVAAKHRGENSVCTNEHQLRNALAIVFSAIALSFPLWGAVLWWTRGSRAAS